jgi:hypothetical protein
MGTVVGLDVSLRATRVCVLHGADARIFEGKAATDLAVLARLIRKRALEMVHVGLERGPTLARRFHTPTTVGATD